MTLVRAAASLLRELADLAMALVDLIRQGTNEAAELSYLQRGARN
jgi:hypothetical protein